MKTPSKDQPTLPVSRPSCVGTSPAPSRSVAPAAAGSETLDLPPVVSPAAWLVARQEVLREEKELTRRSDALAARRRALPWVRIEKDYRFESARGPVSLADLFGRHRQLIVQHFMLGPDWDEGCKSCSFMLDHLEPTVRHLAARGVSFAAVSHAPWAEILPFKERMGWNIAWVSAHGTEFNRDFHVSYAPEELARGPVFYNYAAREMGSTELPGLSVFARDPAGTVYHTYSTYGRGVELAMTTYRLLDLVPRGRDEAGLEYSMAWVRHHDRYDHEAAGT